MRKVTTKVDVFSFGVVVMEFLTGRRPTGLEEENGLPITLPQLVQKSLENGINSVLQIIDPLLASNVSKNEGVVEDLLKLAFSCTCPVPEDRPDMDQVLSFLSKVSKIASPHDHTFLTEDYRMGSDQNCNSNANRYSAH